MSRVETLFPASIAAPSLVMTFGGYGFSRNSQTGQLWRRCFWWTLVGGLQLLESPRIYQDSHLIRSRLAAYIAGPNFDSRTSALYAVANLAGP